MREELERKVAQSIKLLKVACKGKKVEFAYSGGKDSDVILNLAKEAEIDFVPIYKMTTIDPPLTIKHANDGSRLAFKTRELAEYCGKQFMDIWCDYLFG